VYVSSITSELIQNVRRPERLLLQVREIRRNNSTHLKRKHFGYGLLGYLF
jgi:hypothetical protein